MDCELRLIADNYLSMSETTNQENDNPTKWDLCFFCQKLTQEKLVNPSCKGYDLVAKNLTQFYKLGKLPFNFKESLFTSENNLKNVLCDNHALWHKSCYLECSNSRLERAQLRINKAQDEDPQLSSAIANTRSHQSTVYDSETCLFCDLPGTKTLPLCHIMKKSCNDNILDCAMVLKDYKIVAKVSERCDLIAMEAKYHLKCLCEYRRRAATQNDDINSGKNKKEQIESITFAWLVAYINEARESIENPIFNMADLAKLQTEAMKDLGVDCSVHSTRLKEKLLKECPYLIACNKKGLTSLITFNNNVDFALRSQTARNYDGEGAVLSEVANILRSDMFNDDNPSGVPASLTALITMIIYGPTSTLNGEVNNGASRHIAELIVYNALKNEKNKSNTSNRKHLQSRETPTPVFLAAKLYAETRKRHLIDITYQLGLSISYKRLQAIITKKANAVCELYHKDNVVCPPKLKKGLFTTAAVDNIDHNPTSTSAKTAFHGTAITLMQHKFPEETGSTRDFAIQSDDVSPTLNMKVKQLPSDYAVVPPCFVDIKKATCPQSEIYTHDATTATIEKDCLESTLSNDFKPWAAHHAETEKGKERHSTDIAILPLFKELAHTPAMMLHSMDIVAKSTQFINPHQIPVIVADQPLYTLLKQLQYLFPLKVGEDKIFIMMGGLHIEMAALRLIGQWLSGSGWVEALVQANVTTQGRAESILAASNVTRTRHAHQVTAAALYSLQKEAYQAQLDVDDEAQGPLITFEEWRLERITTTPQFKYWDLVLNLELMVLQFVGSIRKGDFKIYLDSIRRILPWFFALDHINYSRWLSVHLRDLVNLKKMHPDLLKHFEKGQFVAKKTDRPFSGIALDQAHEQMNAILKGDGGIIGITENADSLRKWVIAAPELAALIESFESEILQTESAHDYRHHSDTAANQKIFMCEVQSLIATIKELGSPFLEETKDLYNIDTKSIASSEVVETVLSIETFGEEQYQHFCKERLNGGKSLLEPIKLNKYALFSTSSKKSDSKTKAKIVGLKNDCSLFSKLYIATCEHRTGNLDSFFAHENQASPPSLSVMGKMRSGTKSDLLKCLINHCAPAHTAIAPSSPPVSAKVLDGSALVHMLCPGNCKIFQEYADTVFIPFLHREFATVSRIDLVWDRYDTESLKKTTRDKRGTGQRTRVTLNTKIPKGWVNFLRDSSNKEELFQLLTSQCHAAKYATDRELYVTDGQGVLSKSSRDKQNLEPCNHEEADTRMMVHVADAVAQGHTKIMLRSVDTDVVVLAVACVSQLPELQELWVHIGTGKHHQFLSCHAIAASLGPEKAEVLPFFHAFSGCDTVSFLCGKGKKSVFQAWSAYPAATEGFKYAKQGNVELALPILERFVIVLYDKSGTSATVNECRKVLFTKKSYLLENLPPTEDALRKHILRAVYQGGYVWGQIIAPQQQLVCPTDWGWSKQYGYWEPVWTSLPAAAAACLELIRCRCKTKCAGRCNCIKRELKCTDLCECSGNCNK